jgi:hypothetical protein
MMSHSHRGYRALERDEQELEQHGSGLDHGFISKAKAKVSNWRSYIVTGILIMSNISTLAMLQQRTEDQRPEVRQSGMLISVFDA